MNVLEAGARILKLEGVEWVSCFPSNNLIEAAAKESVGILMVGFNRRFSPYVKAIRDHFDGRKEPLAMIYRINAGRIELDGPSAWVHDPGSGGGRIIGEACHFIDTMQAITGARPVDLHATGLNPRRADLSASDVVTMTIGFDDGSMGTVHYFANGNTSFPKERLEIFGQEKIAVIDDWRSLDLIDGDKTKHQSAQTMQKGFAEEAQAFLEGCRSGIAPIPASSLIDTTLVTLLTVEDLAGAWDETL